MEKLHASLILEILGRPIENVKEAIQNIVAKMSSEKGVKILNKNYHEPIPVEGSEDLFTTFAEVEIEFDAIENYLGILFAYMPSNIDVINPERINITNVNLNDLGNRVVQRLHEYDAITKNSIVERDIVLEKLKEFVPEVYKELTTPPDQRKQKKD